MKMKKIFAAAVSLSLVAAASAVAPVHAAAATSYSATLATEEGLTSTKLDKYLVMDADANVPNATFTFSVTQGDAIDADTEHGKLAVLKGIGSPEFTETMTFSTADNPTDEADKGTDTPVFATTDDTSDEKYVKKTLTLDFSSVTFTEPGVYRYIIEETGTNQGITNGYSDLVTKRTLDVYVEDAGTTDADNNPQLKIAGYVMYNGEQTEAPDADKTAADEATVPNGAEVDDATKNATITNLYESQNLTFGKIVTGNQGSKDKYFKYTVEIGNISAANAKFTVDLAKADTAVGENAATKTEYVGESNPDELVANTSATDYTVEEVTSGDSTTYKITAVYYLQHGQYITIQGLPKGATYSVSEDAEDYTPTDSISQADSTLNWDGTEGFDALDDDVSGEIEDEDIYTGYTNDRSGVIPTGVLSTVAGSIGLAAIGIAGIAGGAIYLKKKKSEDDEEE